MAVLSVNINKIATIRNSRGGNNPDVIKTALDVVHFGADGITVHPRPDERHIKKEDVYALKKVLKETEFNIEGFPCADFITMICEIRPTQVTLVPDPPHVLTSNAGWNISANKDFLQKILPQISPYTERISLFIDPYKITEQELCWIKKQGVHRIELYTEMYAKAYATSQCAEVVKAYQEVAFLAERAGLSLNAGHDLDLNNLRFFCEKIPSLKEVSIGHALICDALYYGLAKTIELYKKQCHI